ncbi:MAG: hypothetical protein HGA76_07355, partial [Candidatus Firestonebacteria bacterium]|nr:hypothetical protein [Candidatus Firestonebacteria bacterium]
AQGQAPSAARVLSELLSRYPEFQTAAAYLLASTLLAETRHGEAELAGNLANLHTPLAAYIKSRLALTLPDQAQAPEIPKPHPEAPPYTLPTAANWIELAMEQGRWAQALAFTEQLGSENDLDPGIRADLSAVRGNCLFNLQRFNEAITAYRAWLSGTPPQEDPCLAGIYQRLAQAYYHEGKDSPAMTAYKKSPARSGQNQASAGSPEKVFPLRFEQARQAAEKSLWESRSPRAASPWLAMVKEPPVVQIQPPRSPAPMQTWSWVILDGEGRVRYRQQGRIWPDKLAWEGSDPDGQKILAGDVYAYTLTVVDARGRTLTTNAPARMVWAMVYPGPNDFVLSLQVSTLFEKENSDRISRFGLSLLTQAADLCLRFSRPGLQLELSARDGQLGQRQASAVIARLQSKLEWPSTGISIRILPSRGPTRERLNLRFEKHPESAHQENKNHAE